MKNPKVRIEYSLDEEEFLFNQTLHQKFIRLNYNLLSDSIVPWIVSLCTILLLYIPSSSHFPVKSHTIYPSYARSSSFEQGLRLLAYNHTSTALHFTHQPAFSSPKFQTARLQPSTSFCPTAQGLRMLTQKIAVGNKIVIEIRDKITNG